MYVKFVTWLYEMLLTLVSYVPSLPELDVPSDVYTGIDGIFSVIGWFMPYNIYSPLISFILALTAFRICWAIFVTFKR